MTVFEQLLELFEAGGARFRVVHHSAEGRSDLVAAIRGTTPSQAAKAMVCELLGGVNPAYVLVILAGDRRLDFASVARHFAVKKAKLADRDIAEELTGCITGAIPPVALNFQLPLVVDADLLATEVELAFNAGALDRSIVISTEDYCRIVDPVTADVAQPRAA